MARRPRNLMHMLVLLAMVLGLFAHNAPVLAAAGIATVQAHQHAVHATRVAEKCLPGTRCDFRKSEPGCCVLGHCSLALAAAFDSALPFPGVAPPEASDLRALASRDVTPPDRPPELS